MPAHKIMEDRQKVVVYLSRADKEKLARIAAKAELYQSELVRMLLRKALHDEDALRRAVRELRLPLGPLLNRELDEDLL